MITKKSEIKYIQLGNRKLPKTTGIFNLPSHTTCPGRTAFCSQHCYAMKAEKMYPQVLPFRLSMMLLSTQKDFVSKIDDEIKYLEKKKIITTIRVHESGDFYSQTYLDNWFDIARKNKSVMFYAYTKSFQLNFNNKPENFIIFYSTDKTTKYPMPEGINNEAILCEDSSPITFVKDNDTKLCWNFKEDRGSKCKECNYCYTNPEQKKKVVFFLH